MRVVFDPINPAASGAASLVAPALGPIGTADDSKPGRQVVGLYKPEKVPAAAGKPRGK